MRKFVTTDYMEDIAALAKAGKEAGLGTQMGHAKNVFINAVQHGGVPAGEQPELKVLADEVWKHIDFKRLQVGYDALTSQELEVDREEWEDAEDAYIAAAAQATLDAAMAVQATCDAE